MIKLLAYMTTPGGLTGGPRRLLTLASVLRDQGIEVRIASQSGSELIAAADMEGHGTFAVDAAGVLARRHGALFCGGWWFKSRIMVDLVRQNWRLLRCIRKNQNNVVWIRGAKGIAFGALGAVLSGRPLVWDVDYELPSQGVVRALHRVGLWAASAVVFQYAAAPAAIFGESLAERYRHRFRAIIPGIDLPGLEAFRRRREERIREKHEPFVILQVGTVCERKNQMASIKALARIMRTQPRAAVQMRFAGGVFEEEYARTLQGEAEAQGLNEMVEFLGWRSDIHELMVDADLLVMPSRDEGVPNTVQEAMAVGVPVVVSDAGGMPEIIADGSTGWILREDSEEGWANRIRWCVENPEECEAIGQQGSAYALRWFGTQRWGREYCDVVSKVVKR